MTAAIELSTDIEEKNTIRTFLYETNLAAISVITIPYWSTLDDVHIDTGQSYMKSSALLPKSSSASSYTPVSTLEEATINTNQRE